MNSMTGGSGGQNDNYWYKSLGDAQCHSILKHLFLGRLIPPLLSPAVGIGHKDSTVAPMIASVVPDNDAVGVTVVDGVVDDTAVCGVLASGRGGVLQNRVIIAWKKFGC